MYACPLGKDEYSDLQRESLYSANLLFDHLFKALPYGLSLIFQFLCFTLKFSAIMYEFEGAYKYSFKYFVYFCYVFFVF